jgi:hypothetical protein
MNGLNTFLTFALGLILRIGIPLAVTAGVIYLLHRLDQRWQKEALSVPLAAPGGKPCWEVKECPDARHKACPAAAQPKVPCWQVFRSKTGLLREECLGCDVFRQASAPVLI